MSKIGIPTNDPHGNKQQKQIQETHHEYLRRVLNLAINAIAYEHCARIKIVNEIPKNAVLSLFQKSINTTISVVTLNYIVIVLLFG